MNSGASLTLNNNLPVATGRTATVNGTLNCGTSAVTGAGGFTLNSGATLGIGSTAGISSTAATGNIQVTGTRTYDAGATYVYNGTANQSVGNQLPSSVSKLTIANTGSSGNKTVTGNSNQTVTGTLEVQSGIYDSHSTYNHVQIDSGATLSLSGDITVSGNWTNNNGSQGSGLTANGFKVTFNGAANQTIGGTTSTTFAGLEIANTGSASNNMVSLYGTDGASTPVASSLTVTSGIFDQGTGAASCDFRTTGSGTVATVASGATWQNLGNGDVKLSGDVSNAGTIVFNANGTACGDTPSNDDILIRSVDSSGTLITTQRTWSGTGTFSMTDVNVRDQKVPGGVTAPIFILVNSGTNAGNNTGWTFVDQCTSGTYTWIGGTAGAATDWTVGTNWNPTRATPATGDILYFDGTSTPSPTVTNVATQTITALRLINNVNGVTLSAGADGNRLTISGSTGTDFSVPSGSVLTLSGSNALKIQVSGANQGSVGGQVIMQGGAHQLIGAAGSAITFSNGSTFTTTTGHSGMPFGSGGGGANGADSSIAFQSGSAANFGGSTGDPFGNSANPVTTFASGSTQTFFTSTALSYGGRSYGNLVLDGSQTYDGGSTSSALTVQNSFTLQDGSTFKLSSAADLNLLGNFIDNSTSSSAFNPNSRAVNFNGGNTTQTITKASGAETFFDLTISETSGGKVQLLSAVTINGQLNLSTAASVLELNGKTLTLNGTVTGTGNLKGDSSATLAMTGTGALGTLTFLGSFQTLSSMTMNRTSSGSAIFGNNMSVGSVTLTNGVVNMGSFTLSITGAVSRTGGWIIGNEQLTRSCSSGPGCAFTFDVGTANGYSPVQESLDVGTAGSYTQTIKAVQGQHPSIHGVSVNALQRYWTLSTPTGAGSVSSADVTFNYLAGDVVGTESNYKIFRYDGAFTQLNPDTLNTTSHFAKKNGVIQFSDWTLAEAGAVTSGTISFVSAPYTDSETNANHDVTITVRRSGGSDGAVSVNFAVTDGTATIADNDYSVSPASGTFNWADNDTADKTITINVKGDQKYENNETVNLALSSATGGATIGTPNPTTLTITNDDTCAQPPLNLRAWWKGENDANDSAGPNNGQMVNGATFAAGKVGQAMSFSGPFQYMKANGNSSLVATGQFSIDLWANFNSVPRTGNASDNMRLVENIQNYQLTWRADTQVMEFDIADACDGDFHLGFTAPLPALAAGAWHHYAVTAVDGGSGGPTFHFYFDGVEQTITATPSSGHSACGWYQNGGDEFHLGLSPTTFPLLAYNGLLDEIEIFSRALTSSEVTSIYNADFAGKCAASTVSVAVAPASVAEDQSNNLVYTFTRDGDISVPVTVNFNVGGDAQFSTDYTQSGAATFTATNGTVTFAAGNSTTTITVDPAVDGTVEPNETVTLTLASGVGYYVGSPNAATGTILNDDSQPDLVLNKTDSVDPATEGNLLTYSLAIQNNGGNATNVVITDTLPTNVTFVTASAGCTNSSGTVTCNVGSVPFQTSATRTITVIPTHAAALAGSISNTATVTETETDVNTADNTDAETTTVVSATCTAQPSGMTNWWMADSNAKDFIGGQNGTFTNGVSLAAGKVGNAFSFNGVNQYVAISNSDVLPGNFSMDAWIYPTTVANDAWIFSKELANPINTPVGFYVEAGGKVVAGTRGSSGHTQYRTNDVVIVPNQWQHIVVTYNGSAGQGTGQSFKIYVNGINYPSSPTGQFTDQSGGTIGTPYSNGNAKIGSHYNGISGFFPGLIDELEIFNRILTPTEVVNLFDSGTAGKCVTNLSVQKSDSADPIAIGNDLIYTITVAYRGSSPGTNIVATDTLPANVAFVNASAGCSNSSGTVTCNIGTLNNAETSVKTITVTPAASTYGTTLSNTVSVTSDAVETDTSDNSATETTDVGCIAKPTGMTAWWRANNTAADIIGGQNGTLTNGATYAAGKVNQAFSFNGTNQFVSISNMANATSNFSIDAWINPTSVGSDAWIFSQELPATSTPLGIYVDAGGKLIGWTRVSGGNSQYRTDSVAIVPNQWQHVVATYNGSAGTNSGQSWKFYVNGVFFPSATTGQFNDQGGASISGNGNAKIGSHYSGSSGFFPGLIDEVEIFNRILTQADVTRLFNADSLGKCALTDLSLSKSDAPDPVAEANNLVYTLTAHNSGPDHASGVTITDTLPANVSFVTASAGCVESSGTVTCSVGTLANGADAVRTITVTPTHAAAGTTLTNNASVTGAETDKNTSNNSASATTSVAATPDVSVAVSPASRAEDSGLALVYTFTRTVTVGTLTVNFSVGGSADFSTDYNQSGATSFTASSGTVTFADGSATASVSVTPIADTDFEPNETVVLTVTSGTAYNVAANPNNAATGTITNDDPQVETSVAVSSGDLVITDINGGASDDTLTITKNGTNIRISDPNNRLSAGAGATQVDLHTVDVPISSITGSIQVNTLAGNDTLTLNFANGNFIPSGGVSYAGGDPTTGPGDKLIINGGSQGTVTYSYTNAHDGSVVMSNFGTVSFTGLEPLTNTGDSTDTIFNLPSGPNAVTLADDGTSNTLSRLSGATIETTDFANPSNSLKINRGNTADTIAVNALPDFNASLTIGSAGSEFSTITFGGAVTLAANKNLAGNASSTISFSGSSSDIATSGTGTVTLTTARNITMASGSSIGVVNGDLTLNANQQASATSGDFRGILLTNAALTTTGTGKIILNGKGGAQSGTPNHMGIQITSGSLVSSTQATAGAGTITLKGDGASGTQNNRGVEVAATGTVTSVTGDILFTGTGGAGGSFDLGVSILNGGVVSSTGAAKITFNGTGGNGTSSGVGVRVSGEDTKVTSAGGDISFTGFGGNGTADSNHGVSIALGARVSATGGAKITVEGTGGSGTFQNSGIIVSRTGPVNLVATKVTSDSGDILFTGQGGSGGLGNVGWNIDSGATVVATGAAKITINGTGGSGTTDNYGVGFDAGNIVGTGVSAVNGNINITGVSTDTTGTDQDGVRFEDTVGAQAVSVSTTGTGTVTITGTAGDADATSSGIQIVDDCSMAFTGASNSFIADTMDFGTSNVSINANANAVTLRQKTNTQAINLGGADSATQLGLTDTELDLITCGTLNIGNTNSGAITVSADITRGASTAMALTSGGDVVVSGGQINTGGGTLLLHPGASPAAVKPTKSGVDTTVSTLSFASDLAIVINGTTVDTQYTQLNVAGAVDLTGVDLKLSGSYTPVNGDTFTIVNNDGSDAITGTFNGLAEGASIPNFLGSSLSATITYTGGSGNDVVLTVVGTPEIDVKGNGNSIPDGSTTVQASDGTDFGTASVGNSVTHTFTILNTGTAPLTLSGTPKVQVSGANAADFVVTAQPGSPVAASGSTTFIVQFTPSASGVRTATISIANDDPNENPYDFKIQGTGVDPTCAPPPAGMVAWWPGDGNPDDVSGNGNNATLVNGATFGTGKVNQAFSFDGDNDDISIPNNASLQLQNFTIDAWIKQTRQDEAGIVQFLSGGYDFGIFGSAGFPGGNVGGGAQQVGGIFLSKQGVNHVHSGNLVVPFDGNFHHVAVTKSGTTVIFYVDGAASASVSYGETFTFGGTGHIGGPGVYQGFIDEVEIFNTALDASAIQAIYNASFKSKCRTCTTPPTGMMSWWDGSGSGSTANDIAGTNPGTLHDGVTFAPGKVGQAFSFTGGTQNVEVADSPSVSITGALSIDAWINPANLNTQVIASKYNSVTNQVSYNLDITTGGHVLFTVYQDASGTIFEQALSDDTIPAGIFSHIAATFDPVSHALKIYLNGHEVNAPLQSGSQNVSSIADTPTAFRIGAVENSGGGVIGFNGLIDEVELLARVLTPTEIAAIANAGNAGKCAPAPEIDLKGNAQPIADGSTSPSATNDTDFGNVTVGSNSTHTFTIYNLGSSKLDITGITKSGGDTGDFTLGSLTPASPILSGGSATFTVTFAPSATGQRSTTIHIANSDSNEGDYDFAIQGNGLCNTPATPTATNGGPYCEGATIQLNTPTVAGASYSWTGPNSFTSTLQNPTRANATTNDAGSYSVTITVDGCPSAPGSTSVVVNATPATPTATNGGPYCQGATIQLNTPTVSGATYAWTGPGGFTSALQNPTRTNAAVADGGTYSVTVTVNGCTSAAGSTNVVVNATPATPTATNTGPYCQGATIQLNTPTVSGATYAWTGPNGFTSSLQNPTRANSTVADGGTYSVTVTVNGCTSAAGSTNVVVNACAAEIAVEQPAGTDLTSGSPTPINFGSSDSGVATPSKTFTIKNKGTGDLSITGITSDSPEFAVDTTGMSTTVNPNNSTTFKVTFTPAAPGPRNSAIHIANNDSDESSFDINVTGTGNCPTGFVVNSTGDGDDANTGDGICNDGNGKCTLRAAISEANSLSGSCGALTITFNIPANDPGHVYYKDDGVENSVTNDAMHVAFTTLADDTAIGDIDPDYPHSWWRISPQSSLPDLNVGLTINGYSQGANTLQAASPNTRDLNRGDDAILRVEIDGSLISGGTGDGFEFFANDGITIRGLVINHFQNNDIYIEDGGGDTIAGNFIGIDVSGTLVDGTNSEGIFIDSGDGSLIGGDTPADRNVISGRGGEGGAAISINTDFTTVEGNYIGTDRNAVVALPNTVGVSIDGGRNNTIGCEVLNGDNVISGNSDAGVRISFGTGNFVQGNFIGTDKTGQTAIPNSDGVTVFGGQSNYIGVPGFGNVISGNTGEGVELTNSTTGNLVQSNLIGIAADKITPLGNGANGVEVYTSSADNAIGVAPNLRRTERPAKQGKANKLATRSAGVSPSDADTGANTIAYNSVDGVRVTGLGDVNNRISQNSIYSNGGLGINLGTDGVTPNDSGDGDTGPNEKQNFPVILSVTTGASGVVHFSLDACDSCEATPYTVEFFASQQCDGSGNGEGKTYLGSKEVPGSGTYDSDPMTINSGVVITATATDSNGNTSEFSPCKSTATPTATNATVSGQVVDINGHPIEGATVRMSGTQNRLTITDALGNYHFDNVETNGLYVVTPSRANFIFNPSQRSFSQLGAHTEATFTGAASGGTLNPLDTTEYFVRQQYLDFLGREPDESGFNFWVNNIESCSNDVGCREVKRIDTSAAFFLSIEFQQTGYLVYRTYQAAYDDLPNTPVPIRLGEFKPDTQQISNGVVVLQDGWQKKIEDNKQAFFAAFVKRSRFTLALPTTLTPTEFVDRLFANAHVPLTDSDHTAAIAEFGAAADSSDNAARARALRRAAENSTLTRQQFNQAFVLMEYFGYLRRDPNSGQDIDFAGYNFWLDKLNRFNGNFQNAEMVKAFLSSIEYRARFPR